MSGGMGRWRRERQQMSAGKESAATRRIRGDADGRLKGAAALCRDSCLVAVWERQDGGVPAQRVQCLVQASESIVGKVRVNMASEPQE